MGLAAVAGLLFTSLGLAAYTGRWKRWLVRDILNWRYFGFAMLYAGLAFLLFPVAALAAEVDLVWPARILMILGIAGTWITIMAVFWLPKFMRPRWYREWEARGADRNEFARPGEKAWWG